MESTYDWPAVEQAFMDAPDIHPRVSLKDISMQFGMPYQTIRRYAAQHHWNSRRDTAYYEARKKQYPPPRQYVYSSRGMPANVARLLQRVSH